MPGESVTMTEYSPVPIDQEIAIEPLFLEIWSVRDFVHYNQHADRISSLLEAGDEVWLKKDTQGYSHVLLYIGNGEVVHVSSVQKTIRWGKTIITRDKLDDVAKDRLIGIRKTEGLTDVQRQEIIYRATEYVGQYMPYMLSTYNCEHQVKYWISGKKDYRWIVSTQVRDHVVIAIISGIIGAAIGAGLIIGLYSMEVWPIVLGTLGGAVALTIIVVSLKYLISSLENRQFCCGGRSKS